MKAIITFVFFFFVTVSAMANTPAKAVKVETTTMKVELNISIKKSDVQKTQVARLYFSKNSRVNKALKFSTKANRSKMA